MTAFDPGSLLGIAFASLVIAWVLYVACLIRTDAYLGRLGAYVQGFGAVLWFGGWAWHTIRRGSWPSLGGRDLVWLIVPVAVVVALVLERAYRIRSISAAVLPGDLALGGYALTLIASPWPAASAAERSCWFVAYWALSGVAFGALLAAAGLGLLDLVRPLVRGLDELHAPLVHHAQRRTLGLTLIALALALIVGGLRSWLATGAYWAWSPAEGWMLATWAGYLALLHDASSSRWWSVASVAGLALLVLVVRAMGA